MAKIVALDQKEKKLKLGQFEIGNRVVFNYFDKLPDAERDDKLMRAIYIGVLALMEDRLSAFLANEVRGRSLNEAGFAIRCLSAYN